MTPSSKELFRFLDLSTLNSTDTENEVNRLVEFALEQKKRGFQAAALCVFSNFAHTLIQDLRGSGINAAVVACGFPHGQTLEAIKVVEMKELDKLGIEEVDVVINRGLVVTDIEKAGEDLKAMRNSVSNIVLKVILETGELKTPELIYQASRIAIASGADFIKTSTGKSEIGATPEAARIMCRALKEHWQNTNKRVGIKISGGVKTKADALNYYNIVKEELGEAWLHPNYFRIGASSLAKELINKSLLSDKNQN